MSLSRGTPVCAKCGLFMRCEKNGQLVHDPDCDGGFLGQAEFTYWSGDAWKCLQCGAMIVVGFGESMGRFQAEAVFGKEGMEDAIPFRWKP